jgi:hypothetical protein
VPLELAIDGTPVKAVQAQSFVQFLYIPSPITNGLQIVRFQIVLDFLK